MPQADLGCMLEVGAPWILSWAACVLWPLRTPPRPAPQPAITDAQPTTGPGQRLRLQPIRVEHRISYPSLEYRPLPAGRSCSAWRRLQAWWNLGVILRVVKRLEVKRQRLVHV